MRGWFNMKILALGLLIFLAGCSGNQAEEPDFTGQAPAVGEGVSVRLDQDITYIEMLVGQQQLEEARLALDVLLFALEGDVDDAWHQARLNTLILMLEEVDVSRLEAEFSPLDAVWAVIDEVGEDEDWAFVYDPQPSHFGENIGFYIAIKSRTLIEAGDDDPILMKLFVTSDGQMVEVQ